MVWYAAEQVYPGQLFTGYAILGDDVIINDDKVAQQYAIAMSHLQVKISLQKSLVSHKGCGEFAKKFRVRGLSEDLSPVSIASLLNCHHPYGVPSVYDRYGPLRFSTVCRIHGMGSKAISKLPSNIPQWDDVNLSKNLRN